MFKSHSNNNLSTVFHINIHTGTQSIAKFCFIAISYYLGSNLIQKKGDKRKQIPFERV